jgi:pyruvate kinase
MPVPIVAASSDPAVLRQMALMYAVLPIHMPTPPSVYDFRNTMDQLLLTQGLVTTGDPIVLITGEPIGVPGVTNAMSIHYVGDVCRVPG